MKTKFIFASVIAIATLASCSEENNGINPPPPGDHDVAYISIKVNTPYKQVTSRESSEEGASDDENAIKKLYAIAFDNSEKIICYDDDPAAQPLAGFTTDGKETTQKPGAFRVSSGAKGLLLIANPGVKLENVLTNLAEEGMTFDKLNEAITDVNVGEVKDDGKGFTMINSGDMVSSDTDLTTNAKLSLIDISNKMFIVGEEDGQYDTPEDAKKEAEKDVNRIKVKIERLTSKITVESGITDNTKGTNVLPENSAIFEFTGWVLDALNGSVYPWAKKVKLDSKPTNPTFYEFNFYTVDPNYSDNTGILYNPVTNYAPVPLAAAGTTTYCLENTMKSAEQLFKNATRVVIQGNYYPVDTWKGNDWFYFAGNSYENLAALRAEYKPENPNLEDACNRFWTAIDNYAQANNISLTGQEFATLTQEDLDLIPNGGQVVKEEKCIRWFKKGLCYYYYEIRHDEDIISPMAFAKYGVVRNNQYILTLTKVKGFGTPWYPEIINPGDGDPDPDDEIDEMEGYISVEVQIAPWMKWEHEMEV